MIDSVSRDVCCGCEACAQACRTHCIEMVEDDEGFLFPHVDSKRCMKCGLCCKVCPVLNRLPKRAPEKGYAYKTKNTNVLKRTSSGGFFSFAAEKVLGKSGVVFGATFNKKNEVVHSYIDSDGCLDSLRRSKYVQSQIGNAFLSCKKFLEQGREVLFCGTPCQVKALNLFLGRGYNNLTTIDFVCHGVPSPGVFRRYLAELAEKKGHVLSALRDINFRDKGLGFAYSFSFAFSSAFYRENPMENVFLKGFLADLYLRRSCHRCRAKSFSSGADYTMCDFWDYRKFHLHLLMDGSIPGISEVFVFQDKLGIGKQALDSDNYVMAGLGRNALAQPQRWAFESVPKTGRRARFFNSLAAGCGVYQSVERYCHRNLCERICDRIFALMKLTFRRINSI